MLSRMRTEKRRPACLPSLAGEEKEANRKIEHPDRTWLSKGTDETGGKYQPEARSSDTRHTHVGLMHIEIPSDFG